VAQVMRDRDGAGRPRQARPRDALGRPLPYGHPDGVEPVPEEPLPPDQALPAAQDLLDAGRAFSAHEVLEATWKASPPAERALWQGLAQICVALTHARRGNGVGAARLARRAADRLRPYRDDAPHRVDVAGLLDWAQDVAGSPSPDVPRLARPEPDAPSGR
jgi:uncharacterized protein